MNQAFRKKHDTIAKCHKNAQFDSKFHKRIQHKEMPAATATSKALTHLGESEAGLTRFCNLIGLYLYLANQA
jgi:hypothetical protein